MLASLAVDGEVSELERAALQAHTSGCPACAAYADGVVGLVGALRAAPLAEPAQTLFQPSAVRRPRRRAIQIAASAAAVAAAVGLGHVAASLTAPAGTGTPSRAAIAATQQPYVERQQLAMLSRTERLPHGRAVPV